MGGISAGLGRTGGIQSGGFSLASYPNMKVDLEAKPAKTRSSSATKFDRTNWYDQDEAAFTAYPMTMGCWFKTSQAINQALLQVCDKDVALDYTGLVLTSTQDVRVMRAATTIDSTDKAGSYANNAWHYTAAAIDTSAVTIWVDADTPATSTNTKAIAATYDRTSVGRFGDSTPVFYFDGCIQHAFIYLGTITQAQYDWLYNSGDGRDWSDIAANDVGLTETLFALWVELDERTGVAMNKGYGFGGNSIHLAPGALTQALDLDGASYVETDTAPATAYPISFTGLFKNNNSGNAQAVFLLADKDVATEYQGAWLTAADDFLIQSGSAADGFSNATVTGSFADNAWHFWGAVYASAADRTAYIDAVTPVNDVGSITIGATYDRLSVGRFGHASPGTEFTGQQQNLVAWSVALTAAQYTWLYTGGADGLPATPSDVKFSNHPDNPGWESVISWWKLNVDGSWVDEKAGNTLSEGGVPDVATGQMRFYPEPVEGTVIETAGVPDYATEFDGVDQSMTNGSASPLTAFPVSLSCWVKTGAEAAMNAVSIGSDANNRITGVTTVAGAMRGQIRSGGSTISTATAINVRDGVYHHVLVVATSTQIHCWVDGVATTPTGHALSFPTMGEVDISTKPAGGGFWDGSIDEVALFDVELDATDASELYGGGAGPLVSQLVDGSEVLTSGAVPVNAYPCDPNRINGAGEDIAGSVDLTVNNSPVAADGMATGQAIANAGAVSQWVDNTANGNTVVQNTYLKRPTLVRVSGSPGYAIETDGIRSELGLDITDVPQPWVMFVLFTLLESTAAVQHVFGHTNGRMLLTAADARRLYGGSSITGAAMSAATRELWVGVGNGASSKLYVDGGAAIASGDIGAGAVEQLKIGALGGAEPINARFERILLHGGLLTDADINAIGSHLIAADWTNLA